MGHNQSQVFRSLARYPSLPFSTPRDFMIILSPYILFSYIKLRVVLFIGTLESKWKLI